MILVITDDLKARLFREGEDFPFFEQPDYPDGTPWSNREDCERWGGAYLNWMLDPVAYPQPPATPSAWEEYESNLGVVDAGN